MTARRSTAVVVLAAAAAFGAGWLVHPSARGAAPDKHGGPWVIIRHLSPDPSRDVILTGCRTRDDLAAQIQSGDHVYRGCARRRDGYWVWHYVPLNCETGLTRWQRGPSGLRCSSRPVQRRPAKAFVFEERGPSGMSCQRLVKGAWRPCCLLRRGPVVCP